jgi:hypothetical protein
MRSHFSSDSAFDAKCPCIRHLPVLSLMALQWSRVLVSRSIAFMRRAENEPNRQLVDVLACWVMIRTSELRH